jgi:uncharacterized protein (DUF1499 family)
LPDIKGNIYEKPILEIWENSVRRISLYLSVSLLFTGCVSYQLPDQVVKSSAAMSQEAALQTVKTQIARTDKQLGLCSHQVYPPPTAHNLLVRQPAEMNGKIISIRYKAADVSDEAKNIISKTLSRAGASPGAALSTESFLYKFDATSIARIFVSNTAYDVSCRGEQDSTVVELQSNDSMFRMNIVRFNLARENLDTFLAAIKTLAPQAPFRVPPLP